MTNQEIFEAIEHGEVYFDLLYATGVSALQDRMDRSTILRDACDRIRTDSLFCAECLERAVAVSSREPIKGYVHPDATAVAAYVYLLFNSNNEEGLSLIRKLAIQNRGDWEEVTGLIREYAWSRPGLDFQAPAYVASRIFKTCLTVINEHDYDTREANGVDNTVIAKRGLAKAV